MTFPAEWKVRSGSMFRELLFAFCVAVLFTFESWAFGPFSWMYGYGGGLETIPTHLALHFDDRLFSSWAPFVAGGLDRFAFWGNTDPFNWETLFISLFPTWLANGLHRFSQYFVAVLFATKICTDQLRLRSWQASLGGIFYACFSYFTFGEMLAVPALPLFLWLMQRTRVSKSWYWLPLVVGIGFSTFTTFTHTVPYLVAFGALWSFVVLRDASARMVVNLGLLAVGLTIGDLPQLMAAMTNAAASHRVGFASETVDWSLDGLFYRPLRFDYFNQDQIAKRFAWDLPLPLLSAGAIFAALLQKFRGGASPYTSIYLRVFAIYFLLSQRWLLIALQNYFGEWIPLIRGVFIGRFFDVPASFLIAVLLALLVRLVYETIGASRLKQNLLAGVVGLFVLFMMLEPKLFLFYRNGVDGWGELNYRVKSLEKLKSIETEPFRVASVLPLQPAYAYAQGFETADGWANLYPKVYREYWLRVLAPLFKNVPGAKDIFDPDVGKPQDHYIFLGADLTHPTVGALSGEDAKFAVRNGFDVQRRFDLKLLGLLNVKYLLSEFPVVAPGLELVHAPEQPPTEPYSRDWATGLLSPPSGPRGAHLREKVGNSISDLASSKRLKSKGKDVFIYRMGWYVPRFRLVEQILVEPNGDAVLDRLASMNEKMLNSTAVVESADLALFTNRERLTGGQISLIRYSSDHIDLKVSAAGNSFMVITNTWSPYWKATIDGENVALVRTNHVQYGLPIKPGTHTVRLAYAPPYAFNFNRK